MQSRRTQLASIFVLLVILSITSFTYPILAKNSQVFPPPGFDRIVSRVELTAEDHFVTLDERTYDEIPALRSMLENATYWARQNMNQTRHWIMGEDLYQILVTLTDAYQAKYGMNASHYAEVHNTTISDPVVAYEEFYFAIARPLGSPMIVRHHLLEAGDPRLNWNGSVLEGIPELQDALEFAVAWADHDVHELLYDFEGSVFDNLTRSLDIASHDQYGMSWNDVVETFNSSIIDPVVEYRGYFFSFSWAFPGSTPPPIPTLLIVTVALLVGFGLLGVTVLNWRRVRSDLTKAEFNEQ